MEISLGIVGLPNVGKSTLFNLITKKGVPAENYPFCTIDPNIGVVTVPDERIEKIVEISKPEKVIYPIVEFYDIAGLVKGAHDGQGLGNKFLANIRSTNAILHIIRDFVNPNILHVENRINPKEDKEIIEAELILKDLETIEKSLHKMSEEARRDKKNQKYLDLLVEIKSILESGNLANKVKHTNDIDIENYRKSLFLLTDKPVIYVINTDVTNCNEAFANLKRKELELDKKDAIFLIDIKVEAEISEMEGQDRIDFMNEFGMQESALDRLIRESYQLLGLMTYFTAGPQEVRGWTIKKGYTAPQAAGEIHTDFMEKFITAEVVAYEDYIKYGGWNKAKEAGKGRLEGKDYIVNDGDLFIFRHGA